MKAINKEQLLNNLEQKVEQHLVKAVEIFQNLNSHELLKPAANGGWSVAQCLWHLNSYSEYYYPQISAALKNYKGNSIGVEFKSGWLGNYFTTSMEPKPGFSKMKATKRHTPPTNINAHEVVANFIQHQENLLKLIQQSKQVDLNKIKIPTSITKWIKLKLGDILGFLVTHDERHIQQAIKLLP